MLDLKKEVYQRLGIDEIISLAKKKLVPMHRHSFWYYMGGMLLFLCLIQAITGPLLLFYYKPAAEAAHQSVAEIMVNVPYGWLIRSVHHWASNLMIVIAFIHFFSTFLVKAYRRPRELTWLTGMALLGVVLFLGYTGYTLPFDERAFFALAVGTEMPVSLPLIGNYIMEFLRGGESIGPHTLNRFFALHVGILPLCLIAILVIHILLIQLHGMSIPPSVEIQAAKEKRKIPYKPMFPHLVWHDIVNCLIVLGIVVTLAVLIPSELGEEIDYLKPAPAGVKPDWFFLWMYQILKWVPTYVAGIEGQVVGIVCTSIAAGLIVIAPFIDLKSQKNQLSPVFTASGIICILLFTVLTIIGFLT